jgi:hypothetical protein
MTSLDGSRYSRPIPKHKAMASACVQVMNGLRLLSNRVLHTFNYTSTGKSTLEPPEPASASEASTCIDFLPVAVPGLNALTSSTSSSQRPSAGATLLATEELSFCSSALLATSLPPTYESATAALSHPSVSSQNGEELTADATSQQLSNQAAQIRAVLCSCHRSEALTALARLVIYDCLPTEAPPMHLGKGLALELTLSTVAVICKRGDIAEAELLDSPWMLLTLLW